MLRVYYSNRTEELLDALIEHIRAERASLFDAVHVVVPNRNMRIYLELALARATGVCANVRFHLADELFGNGPEIRDRLLAVLFDDALVAHDELEPVRTYLAAGGNDVSEIGRRRVQLGQKLANLYAAYTDYRPELIDCWRAGLFVGDGVSRDVETWQRRLWLQLSDEIDTDPDLPTPLHVFGMSYSSRRRIELLGRHPGDVFVYALNPCQEIWEATSAPAPIAPTRRYERRGKDLGPGEVFSVEDPFRLANAGEMAPLRLWGRAGRENLRLTNALTGCELVPRIKANRDSASLSLLEQIQYDIALRKPERTSISKDFAFDDDQSIVVLEAANVRRELETIAAEIWRLMATDATDATEPLRFNDIAVILVPEMAARYQALVGSVFREMRSIPHNIVDLPVRSESKLVEAVEILLRIPTGEFTRKEVMSFVTHPTVMTMFPRASASDWLRWCDDLGVIRGVDRDDHDGTYVQKDVFNWDQGLKRLALGAVMSGEASGDERLFEQGEDTYLVEESMPEELPSAASFGLFVRSLLADAREVEKVQMTMPAWVDFILAFVTSYVVPRAPEDVRALRKCLTIISSLASSRLGGKKVPYAVALELVEGELSRLSGSRGQYLVDGVVVSSFMPMRAIPFKVVFIAGLNAGKFPAWDGRDHLDLRHAQRRAGDVSPRERDKYLFLETLLCTRERLYLSYVARDELTGDELQPSSMVLELIETLSRGYLKKVCRRRAPRLRVDDDALCRVSPRAAGERRARALGESLRAHVGRRSLPPVSHLALDETLLGALKTVSPPAGEGGEARAVVPVSAIRRFLECPLQGSARFALRLAESSDDDPAAREDELFRVGALERAELLRETFRHGGGADSYDELAHRFELKGLRPTGLFGKAERERHLRIVESWRRGLVEVTGADGRELELSVRKPSSFVIDGVRLDRGPSSLLFLASPRMAIRLCAQHRYRFHPKRESLHGFLDHVLEAASGNVVSEPYTFVAINAPPGETGVDASSGAEIARFTFAPIRRDAAVAYLKTLLDDLRQGVHDYLLPCEVALNGLAPLPPTKTSSRFGPVLHPEDYEPLDDEKAQAIVDRRFGLYFASLPDGGTRS